MLPVWLMRVTKEKSAAKPCRPCALDTDSSDVNSTVMRPEVVVMLGRILGDPETRVRAERLPAAPLYTVTGSTLGWVLRTVNNSSTWKPGTGAWMIHSLAMSSAYAAPVKLMLLATPVMTLVSETARNAAPAEYVNAIENDVVPRKTSGASVPLMAKDEEEKAAAVTPAVPPRTAYTARVRKGTVRFEGVKVLRTKK
jgi:hypothetical protein